MKSFCFVLFPGRAATLHIEHRTLSCQTGIELLQTLLLNLSTATPAITSSTTTTTTTTSAPTAILWQELDARSLLATAMVSGHQCRPQIVEESASDEDETSRHSGKLKQITISLGEPCICHYDPRPTASSKRNRGRSTSPSSTPSSSRGESPISWSRHSDSAL